MLEVRKLNVAYGDLQVLWNVDIDVDDGEIVAVVGANGAGKSSLLKCLSRLVGEQSGSMAFGDVDLVRAKSHDAVACGIVHVPEGRHIFSELTVMENLRMGSFLPAARRKRQQNLARAFELFPRLAERRDQQGGTLSGGEQQMLAIARGLMAGPKLLLLDEPSLGLSPLLVKQIFQIISEIHRQGTSVLLVEQNVRQSLKLCHRAYVLERGRVVMTGRGRDLMHDEHVKTAFLGMTAGVERSSMSQPSESIDAIESATSTMAG
ncbi:MAG TPA: ABC transporter ATP-binding protein [Polyangiaceae bacterium]